MSAIGLGGWHVGKPSLDAVEAVRVIRAAIDAGITFLDNAWDYNEGASDRRFGEALRDGYRKKVFLMSKIDARDRKGAEAQLEESLRRMQVDHIDLMQHHEVIRFDDVDRIFWDDGAHAALVDAQKAGKIRFIGFTGHKDPSVHTYMLESAERNGFTFDAVQLPLNVMDAHFRSFEKSVLPELVNRNIGVLGMKSMGNGVILRSGVVSPEECLRYALTLPASVVITGIDSEQLLEQALRVTRDFRPLTAGEREELLARTAPHAQRGEYELFKTTRVFDATGEHPEWLGEETARTQAIAAEF